MTKEPDGSNQKSIEELERKVFDFFTLSQLGKSFISIQDMENLARVFASAVYESIDAKNVALLIYDIETKQYAYQYSIGLDPKSVKTAAFPEEEGLFWRVLNSGEPFPVRDSSGKYHFETIIKKFNLDVLDSEIWVPLIVKNVLRGVLTLGSKKDGTPYDVAKLSFISQLATQAAVAIDSALLDQQKQRATIALGKKMENLSVLYDVAKAMNFVNDLKKTLLLILDKSRQAVGAEKGSIMLVNKDTDELEVHVVRGIDPLTEKRINDGELECTKIKIGEGIAGRVAKTMQHMLVADTKKDERFQKSKSSNVESIICLPLVAEGECIGVMNVSNKTDGGRFTDEEINLLLTLAGQASVTINNANLYHLAITDGLTQLYINRYFRQKLHDEIIRSKRYNHPLSLIMIDIDNFKRVNDVHGHQQGDLVLSTTAKILRKNLRETDTPCRYGGEEFSVILTETDTEAALIVAENLRKAIEQFDFPSLTKDQIKVTVSLGIASYPRHAMDDERLIEKADKALYVAKEKGRNQYSVFPEK